MTGRTLKITGGVTGVIATGSYQNLRPSFSCEETLEGIDLSDEQIRHRESELYKIAFGLLKEAESHAIADRVQKERQDIRFYIDPKTGVQKPSVTSVISWDIDFFVPPHELTQYASQSQIVHARCAYFVEQGIWVEPKELRDIWADIVIVSKGNLKLEVDTGSFPNFLEKYPIEDMKNGQVVYLENTAGLPDVYGVPKGWKDAGEVLTVFDFKRTPDKIKDGKQLSQYCKGVGAEQGIVIPLNNKTLQGYSKPIVYDKESLAGYDKMFQVDRENFKKRFNI